MFIYQEVYVMLHTYIHKALNGRTKLPNYTIINFNMTQNLIVDSLRIGTHPLHTCAVLEVLPANNSAPYSFIPNQIHHIFTQLVTLSCYYQPNLYCHYRNRFATFCCKM